MKEAKQQLAEWDKELTQLHERNGDLGLEVQNLTEQLQKERADREELQQEFDELNKQYLSRVFVTEALKNENPAAASKDLPEAADLLNQLKTKRKKSKADLADLETILEILES
ncbi:flagellar alpha dynein [Microcoleus sp. herbarium2]|uniref:flagellar alpha dynein n=1 Tax=Microcoleus sp. herbarium2 TaxID=3055433 RepID=UPI002FD74152